MRDRKSIFIYSRLFHERKLIFSKFYTIINYRVSNFLRLSENRKLKIFPAQEFILNVYEALY